MARTRKSIQPLNLYKYDVLVEDRGIRSDYFKISQFDGYFYGGRNAFLVAGASALRPNSKILVEILNKDGKTVYSAPIANFIEGNSRLVQVEVYSDTPIGPGKIVLLGCADTYIDGTPVPEEWKDKYNVRWITDVIISPLVYNKTPIRFIKPPSLIVEEKFYSSPSSSIFSENIQVPIDFSFSPKYYNVFPNGYILNVLPSNTASQFTSDYIDGIITGSVVVSYDGVQESASINFPITKIYNKYTAETQGSLLYTENKNLILNGTFSGSGIYTSSFNPIGNAIVSGTVNLQYNKLTSTSTGSSISFANVRLVDLNTLSGEINKVRISYKASTEPGEFILLSDVNTNVQELLAVDSSSKIAETGVFTKIQIADYWYAATMSADRLDKSIQPPEYYTSSSLSTNLIVTQSSEDLLDSINATPEIQYGKYKNDVVYFIGTKSATALQLFPRTEYTLSFDAVVSKISSSIELTQDDYSLEVYLIKEPSSLARIYDKDTKGQLIGTLTPTFTSKKQNFENVEFNFNAKITDAGDFALRFVFYGGFWNIANVSVKPAQEPFFSPDEIDILVPITNYEDSILTFKAEFLDINNNSAGISTVAIPLYVTGSRKYIKRSGDTVNGNLYINGIVSASTIVGVITGSISNAVSSSYALTASYAANAASGLSGGTTNYIPVWSTATAQSSSTLYQSAAKIGIGTTLPGATLHVQGNVSASSYTGSLFGTASYVVTASTATSLTFTPPTASLAITASYINPSILPTGLISASSQVNHNATTNYVVTQHVDHTIVSITAGSGLSGGGDISTTRTLTLDTSSTHFISGSFNANNLRGIISSSNQVSYTGLTNIPSGIISSSTQVTANLPTGTISSSTQVLYTGLTNVPTGILSSSAQINGLAGVSASFANTASAATSITFIPPTSSFSTTSSYVEYVNVGNKPSLVSASSQIQLNAVTGVTFSNASFLFPQNLRVDGTLTAQEIRTEFITSSVIFESGSTKFGDSADDVHQFTGSLQVLGGITGSLFGTSSWTQNAISGSFATTASAASSITFIPNTASFATTSSFTTTASYVNPLGLPNNIISSSTQFKTLTDAFTGSFTGSHFGTLVGTASWASNAVSASAATSITFVPQSASFANTASAATSITFIPTSSSFATTASYATYAGSGTGFPYSGSAIITGSLVVSGSGIGINIINPSASLHVNGTTILQQVLEKATIVTTAPPATLNYNVLDQAILYHSASTSTHWIWNIRGNSSTPLNNVMYNSQSLTITLVVLQGNTVYVPSTYQIDGTTISPIWQGGGVGQSYPNSLEAYTLTIIKNANTSYDVIGNIARFATGSLGQPVFPYSGSASITGSLSVLGTISGSITFPTGLVSSSNQISYTGITNIPTGILSSSTQINNLSNVSASFATTSSAATSITFTPSTASFATTSSAANSITFVPNTASFATTASAATSITFTPSTSSFSTTSSYVEYTNVGNKPALVSASSQIQLNAITGATFSNASFLFPQNLTVGGTLTAQELRTEFVTSSVIFESGSTKFGDSADDTHQFTGSLSVLGTISGSLLLPPNVVSSSTQIDYNSIQNKPTTIATASYVEFANVANKPTLVSSSTQINTGSFTGSFTGQLIGTSSWANNVMSSSFSTTASAATSITFTPTSSSFATTASYALNAGAGAGFPFNGNAVITGSLIVSGSGIGINVTNPSASLHVNGTTIVQQILEKATITASAPPSVLNYNALDHAILYHSASTTTDWTWNIRGNTSTPLNSVMYNSQSLTLTLLVQQGAGVYKPTTYQVDGVNITPHWQGGSTGSSFSNSIDAYTLTIIKIASASYSVLGTVARFSVTPFDGSIFPYSGSAIITGSLAVLGTISGSLILPTGILSSSTQINNLTNVSASFSTTASYVLPTGLPSATVSSSTQIISNINGQTISPASITGSAITSSGIQTSTLFGDVLTQTSSSVVTGQYIYDTGITVTNLRTTGPSIYELMAQYNPNTAGSSDYRNIIHGHVYINGGWDGTQVILTTQYNELFKSMGSGSYDGSGANANLSFVSASNAPISSEVVTVPIASGSWQLRVRFSDNSTPPGTPQYRMVRLMRRL